MELDEASTATIAVDLELAPRVEAALREEGLVLQQAGPARGAAEAAVLIAVSVPSIVTLALLAEKLRRLKLPRTYIYLRRNGPDIRIGGGPDAGAVEEPEVHVDEEIRDGRIVLIGSDGSVRELLDQEISVAALQRALRPPPSPDA